MRLLHFSKVVFFALFLLLVPAVTATAEPTEAVAAPAFFSDLTVLVGDWVASLFATETPSDPEGAPVFPPNGLASPETGADPEACQVLPPGG